MSNVRVLNRTDEYLVRKAESTPPPLLAVPDNPAAIILKLGFCLTGWFLAAIAGWFFLSRGFSLQITVRCAIVLIVAVGMWLAVSKVGN